MQIPESILLLIPKYLAGKATPEEKDQVNKWYHSQADEGTVVIISETDTELQMGRRIKSRLQQSLQNENSIPAFQKRKRWVPLAAAAAVLVLLFSSLFYFLSPSRHNKSEANNIAVKQSLENKILPGGDKAILTLADGSTVLLDSASNGNLTQQGATKIIKLNDGRLTYSATSKEVAANDPVLYNTVATPRGGQYQVTLSDGTKVWLNASSSIRFPTAFTGNERKVQIVGEAYFEVAGNKHLPFKVSLVTRAGDSSLIEVLGTHFDVNAYNDESSVKTTLLQGSVKITNGKTFLMLSPGQQSELNNHGELRLNKNVDLDEVVSWKNGLFNFAGADIKTIMRQISRWYELDVSYEGNISPETFSGIISRNSNIEKVLHIMEQAGVDFKIEGKKIIVTQ